MVWGTKYGYHEHLFGSLPDVRVVLNGLVVVKDKLAPQAVQIESSCHSPDGYQTAVVRPLRHFYHP